MLARPGATDLLLAAIFVVIAAAGPIFEPSHWQFWILAPLGFAIPLAISGVLLLRFRGRASVIAVQIIQSLLLVVTAHLLLLSALSVMNPSRWGWALFLPWPSLLVGANAATTLLRLAPGKDARIRSCLVPAGGCVVVIPLTMIAILGWQAFSSALHRNVMERTALAAEARTGHWQVLMTDPVTRSLHRWQFDQQYSGPLRPMDDPYLLTHGFDVTNNAIALFESQRPTVRNIATGELMWQGQNESEELRCIRFEQRDDALTYVTVDRVVRLTRAGRREELARLPSVSAEDICPSLSQDSALMVWSEGSAKPFVVLSRVQEGQMHEIARWPLPGRPFLTPDGRTILVFDRLLVQRIDVATGRISRLASLPQRPRQKNERPESAMRQIPGVPDTHWPQAFSPDGKWFLVSSREADPCERVFLAINVDNGALDELPIDLPRSSCVSESFGWTEPNLMRWIADRQSK